MKKILLAGTALVTLVAGVAEAAKKKTSAKVSGKEYAMETKQEHKSAFKIDLHGRQEFNLALRSVKSDYLKGDGKNNNANGFLTQSQKNFAFDSNTKLNLVAAAHTDYGMTYGANISLAPAAHERNRSFSSQDKTFLFLESKFGRAELGSNYSALTAMEIGAHSVAAGSGGASDGYWFNYVNVVDPSTGKNVESSFVLQGRNSIYRGLVEDNPNVVESSRKISYFTPSFSGLQLGFSYVPDMDNNGSTAANKPNASIYLKDVYTATLKYEHKVKEADVAAEVHYQGGKNTLVINNTGFNNLREWGVGTKVAMKSFSLAASYDDAGKSNFAKTDVKCKNNYWTVGLGYEMGKYAASVTYLNGRKGNKDNTLHNYMSTTSAWSLGIDYKLASGFKTYAEITNYTLKNPLLQFKNPGTYSANKGNVFLLGAVLKF